MAVRYEFDSEIVPELRHDQAGTLAYANPVPTRTARIFTSPSARPSLDGGYVVFGYCDNVGVVEQIVPCRGMPTTSRTARCGCGR